MTSEVAEVALLHPDSDSLGEYVSALAASQHQFSVACSSSVDGIAGPLRSGTVDCLVFSRSLTDDERAELDDLSQSIGPGPATVTFEAVLCDGSDAEGTTATPPLEDPARFADRIRSEIRRQRLRDGPVQKEADTDSPEPRNPSSKRELRTDRHDRQLTQLADHLDEVVWMTDADKSEIVYVNPAYEEVWGRSQADLYEDPRDFLRGIHPDDRERVADALSSQVEGEYDETYRVRRPDGTVVWVRDQAIPIVDEDGEVRRVVGIAEDITRYKRREQMLTSFHEATRSLMVADTTAEVADQTTHIAKSVLNLSAIAFYGFDTDADTLRPLSWSENYESQLGETPPAFSQSDQSITWKVYRSGQAKVFADIRQSPSVYNRDTPFRSALIVPVGTHGVIIAASPNTDVFETVDLEFTELLARTAEVILSRIEREETLAERTTTLERRTEELGKETRISSLARDIDSAVSDAKDRRHIEQRVCDSLVADEYVCCWIGDARADEPTVAVRASAVSGDSSLSRVDITRDDAAGVPTPIREAVREERVVTTTLDASPQLDVFSAEERDPGVGEVALVPLVSGPTNRGVLAIYSRDPGTFGPEVREVLAELGETIGFAITAAENRQLLFSDAVPELTLRTRDEASPLIACSNRHNCTVTFEQVVMLEESVLAYVTVDGADSEAVLDDLLTAPTVQGARLIGDGDSETRCELQMTAASKVFQTVECGAQIRAAEIADGVATITAHVSPDVDVRRIVADFESVFPDVELMSKRNVTQSRQPAESGRLSELLSERQRQILCSAFLAGYFDWPRETTIEQLAERFDLSSATVNYHLRNGLANLLDANVPRNRTGSADDT